MKLDWKEVVAQIDYPIEGTAAEIVTRLKAHLSASASFTFPALDATYDRDLSEKVSIPCHPQLNGMMIVRYRRKKRRLE